MNNNQFHTSAETLKKLNMRIKTVQRHENQSFYTILVSTKETTLVGRISDVVQLGHGSNLGA
jgi:uncharacterized protein with von Willebrand factor type A (vWA) domain